MPAGNEYYQNASETVIDLYSQIENDLLENIAKKLGTGKSLFQQFDVDGNTQLILDWQAARLAELGALTKQNAAIIARYSGIAEDEIDRIFKDVVDFQTKGTEAQFQEALKLGGNLKNAVPINESATVQQILNSAIGSTQTTFGGVDQTMLRQASSTYKAAVNQISAKVLAGTKTATQAVSEAVSKMAEEGITAFITADGKKFSAEAYAALVMRANTKNTVTAIQEQRAIEYGNDYIEVNAYTGARPKCSIDQGLIYSRSGNTDPIEDLDGNKINVLSWGQTSFGEPDGILGINCGHQRFDFIPGFSTQQKERINQRENDQEYREKQLQRRYERDIRKAKREKNMLESAGASPEAIQKAQSKITREQTKMREFINRTDRTRRPARERVGLPVKQTTPRAKPKPKPEVKFKTTKDLPFKINLKDFDPEYRKLLEKDILEISNRYPGAANNLTRGINQTSSRKAYGMFRPGIDMNKKSVYYRNNISLNKHLNTTEKYLNSQTRTLANRGVKLSTPQPTYTLWHEFGHAIDDLYLRAKNPVYEETFEKYLKMGASKTNLPGLAGIQEINKANRIVVFNTMGDDIFVAMRDKLGINNIEMQKLIRSQFGSYANSARSEFVAEGFAQWSLTPAAEQSEALKLFGEVFEELLGEAIGG